MNEKDPIQPKNSLWHYLRQLTVAQRIAFASAAGTSVGYLQLPAHDRKNIGPELAVKLEQASKRFKGSEGLVLDAEILCPKFDWAGAAYGRCATCKANLDAHRST